ncbi:hypothetical protein EZV73_24185 [Acidaminobacter sp. JC074]|uniref:hypothetical protein n=1 Tax=Acidaminobacter sp. JC074 TaxID=2530199 RepID=UPI001F1164EA|nr:hypothetical protein [Acidaminobacter sp. JC074]MCH4890701.1 hypothetical protein [Acidaminobacter sp. JC074]
MKKIVLIFCMIMLLATTAYAEEVEVVIPEFDVTINGNIIDNQTEQYPFITYKGITYIPMTWDLSYALGLELNWEPSNGLKVSKRDKMKVYVQKEKTYNNLGKPYPAEAVSFPVKVNGKAFDNSIADYPLLNFRNITYFPMTYDYMVNEFNSGYKWDDILGLLVSADENLEISIPEPYYVSLKVNHEELKEKGILAEQMIHVEYDGDYEDISVVNGLNHEYDGYYYNLYISHYNDKDELIYTDILMNANIYESVDDYTNPSEIHGMPSDPLVTEAYYVLDLELLPIPVARAEFLTNYKDVLFTYFDEVTLSYEDLMYEGAVYMEAHLLPGSFNTLPGDLIPFAAAKSTQASSKDGENFDVNVYASDSGKVSFEPVSKSYIPLKKFNRAYIDPRELNWGLKLYNNNALVDEIHKGYIKLYDKDYKLIKVMINKAEVDSEMGIQ